MGASGRRWLWPITYTLLVMKTGNIIACRDTVKETSLNGLRRDVFVKQGRIALSLPRWRLLGSWPAGCYLPDCLPCPGRKVRYLALKQVCSIIILACTCTWAHHKPHVCLLLHPDDLRHRYEVASSNATQSDRLDTDRRTRFDHPGRSTAN